MKTVLSYIKKLRLWLWRWIKRLWQYIGTFLVFFFISLYIIFCFHFFREDPQLASAAIALGTLILALVTALHIVNSNRQEKRRRDDAVAKEKRDRKERLLNEIIEWAVDVAGCGSDINIPFFPEVSELSKEEQARERITEGATRASLGNLLLRYKVIVARREYVKNIALFIGEDLPKKEKEVANNLNKVVDLLEKRIKGNATTEMVTEAEKSLNECARILIEEATKIMTRDIG